MSSDTGFTDEAMESVVVIASVRMSTGVDSATVTSVKEDAPLCVDSSTL